MFLVALSSLYEKLSSIFLNCDFIVKYLGQQLPFRAFLSFPSLKNLEKQESLD